jgi:hypothetical protein
MRSAIRSFLGGDNKEASSRTDSLNSQQQDTTLLPTDTTTSKTTLAPAVVNTELDTKETHLDRPEVINETIKPTEVREVQPVIDVHREQKEVHQVLQPVTARQELPLQVHEEVAPVQSYERKEAIPEDRLRELETGLQVRGGITVEGKTTTVVEKPPIVNEHIHKTIIEEVQPVIYKETIEPHLIHQTVPIVERVVEAPTVIKEVRPVVQATEINAPLTGHTITPK